MKTILYSLAPYMMIKVFYFLSKMFFICAYFLLEDYKSRQLSLQSLREETKFFVCFVCDIMCERAFVYT